MNKRIFKKTHFILILLALLTIGGIMPAFSAEFSLKTEGEGFDSPEGAIMVYLEGLRDLDLSRMMSAFAVESYVENFNFEAQLNRIRAYSFTSEIKLPNANKFVTALNIESRKASVNNMILCHYIILCEPEFNHTQVSALKEEANVTDFAAKLNTSLNALKFQTLKITGFVPPASIPGANYSEPRNLEVMARNAGVRGADNLESRIAVFSLDGKEYAFCLDVINYGGKWYISQLGGNIGSLLRVNYYSAGTIPVTPEMRDEFHKLLVPVK